LNEGEAKRLVLKEDDILLVKIPVEYFNENDIKALQKMFIRKLKPRNNKILIIPNNMDISVIGKKEIKEIIRYSDEWELWEGEEDV
jgi:hypothetical protein